MAKEGCAGERERVHTRALAAVAVVVEAKLGSFASGGQGCGSGAMACAGCRCENGQAVSGLAGYLVGAARCVAQFVLSNAPSTNAVMDELNLAAISLFGSTAHFFLPRSGRMNFKSFILWKKKKVKVEESPQILRSGVGGRALRKGRELVIAAARVLRMGPRALIEPGFCFDHTADAAQKICGGRVPPYGNRAPSCLGCALEEGPRCRIRNAQPTDHSHGTAVAHPRRR